MGNSSSVSQAINWSALDVVLRYGINFVALMILARLLLPADFGSIAILMVFTSVAALFIDGGLGQALIQRKNISHIDE